MPVTLQYLGMKGTRLYLETCCSEKIPPISIHKSPINQLIWWIKYKTNPKTNNNRISQN
jgi:hypothetical protein